MIAVSQLTGGEVLLRDKRRLSVTQFSLAPVDAATGRRLTGRDVDALTFAQFSDNAMLGRWAGTGVEPGCTLHTHVRMNLHHRDWCRGGRRGVVGRRGLGRRLVGMGVRV